MMTQDTSVWRDTSDVMKSEKSVHSTLMSPKKVWWGKPNHKMDNSRTGMEALLERMK